MEIITVFLITLVIALIIGNLLLTFTGSKRSTPLAQRQMIQPVVADSEIITPHLLNESKIIQSNLQAINQKTNMAHNRLNKLEKLLLTNGNSVLTYNLREKMRKLDNFRANTEVELKAIKEIIEWLQSQNEKVKKSNKRKKGKKKERELTPEEMHKIIYKSG